MNEENTEKLYSEFPELYRGKKRPISESSMSYGFAYGDGWFDLIYKLSKEIVEYCQSNNIEIPEVRQVKEKLGTLKFYLNIRDQYICNIFEEVEIISAKTCEICGKDGKTQATGYQYSTLCSDYINFITRRGKRKKVW